MSVGNGGYVLPETEYAACFCSSTTVYSLCPCLFSILKMTFHYIFFKVCMVSTFSSVTIILNTVCLYHCMMTSQARTSKKVANPALLVVVSCEHENGFLPCPRLHLNIWPRETGSAVPSRVSPLRLNRVLTDFYHFFPLRRPYTILRRKYIPSTAIRPVPSQSGHAINCVLSMEFPAESP